MAKQIGGSTQMFNGTTPIGQRATAALKAAAQPLVDRLKKRARLKTRSQSKIYEEQVRRCIVALKTAHESIQMADARLAECKLDREDARQIDQRIFEIMSVDHGLVKTRHNIAAGSDCCRALANIISDVTGVQEIREPGRPASQYVQETRELIKFFETVTKKRVVFPKQLSASPSTASHQPSTEFIRLRLQEIDPNVTLSEAITCIRNALK